MPLDQTTTDATEINKHVADAARWLWRSMEAESSMCREQFCRHAALALFNATALADGEERRILSAHFRQAQTLAVLFYGDGTGVQRLLDELQTLTGAVH